MYFPITLMYILYIGTHKYNRTGFDWIIMRSSQYPGNVFYVLLTWKVRLYVHADRVESPTLQPCMFSASCKLLIALNCVFSVRCDVEFQYLWFCHCVLASQWQKEIIMTNLTIKVIELKFYKLELYDCSTIELNWFS